MKYSQAVLVACVGSAALVSAAPSSFDSLTDLNARAPEGSDNAAIKPKKTPGYRFGKAITYGGKFAEKASGMGSYNSYNNLERRARSGTGSRESVKQTSKERVKQTGAALKRVGSSTVDAAGGGSAVAENLGSMAYFAKDKFRSGQQQNLDGRNLAEDPSSVDPATQAAAAPPAEGGGKGNKSRRGKNKGKGMGRGKMSDGEKKHRKEAGSRMSPEEKAKARQDRKAAKKARKGGKTDPAASAAPSGAGDESSTPPPTDAPVSARDFDEDIFTRDVEDELAARGFFANLKTNYRLNKAESLQSKADKTQGQADRAQSKAAERTPGAYRREFDELDAREFDELDARDFDEELAAREFDDELAARGLGSAFRAVKDTLRGHRKSKGVSGGSYPDPNMDPSMMTGRDLTEEGSLAMRDLEEVLSAREFEDILESRDFEDELAARGPALRSAWRDTKSRIEKSKGDVPTDIPSDPSQSQPQSEPRDFEDELAARTPDSHGSRRGSKARSRKPKVEAETSSEHRDFFDEDALAMRDLDDALASRDLEDELAARGFGDAFRALKDTLRGSRKPKGGASLGAASSNMDPYMMTRDYFDALDTREINELD